MKKTMQTTYRILSALLKGSGLFLLLLLWCAGSNAKAQYNESDYTISFSASPTSVACDAQFNLSFSMTPKSPGPGLTQVWSVVIRNNLGVNITISTSSAGSFNVSMLAISAPTTYTIISITQASSPVTPINLTGVHSVTVGHTSTLNTYPISSPLNVCASSPAVIILGDSDLGVNYELQRVGTPNNTVVQSLPGTGGALNFVPVSTSGSYVIVGKATGCSGSMAGTVEIADVFNSAAVVVANGSACLPGSYSVQIPSSQRFWMYELLRDGNPTGQTLAGTGSSLAFLVSVAGKYTVRATSVCGTQLLSGEFNLYAAVSSHSVTGVSVCLPSITTVGLASSTSGVQYQLYRDGISVGTSVPGTGGVLSFGSQSAVGVYTIGGSNGSCTATMNGSVTVSPGIDPLIVLTSDTGCSGVGNTISLTGSQAGVEYQLLLNGNPVAGQLKTGTGLGSITFTGVVGDGIYTVRARSPLCNITTLLTGSYEIKGYSGAIANATYCAGSTFTITVSPVEAGVTYTLYRGTTSLPPANATGIFTRINEANAGDYTVVAQRAGCAQQILPGVVKVLPVVALQTMTNSVAALCSNTIRSFGLTGSQLGVTYVLYRDGVAVESKPGTGGVIAFTTQAYAPGTYSVQGSNGACAPVVMASAFTVVKSPSVFPMENPGPSCQSVGLIVKTTASEAGVTYSLYNGATLVASNGTGNFGLITNPGTYTIQATLNGCTEMMTGTAVVNASPNVLAFSATGIHCPDHALILTGASEVNVAYRLYRDGVYVGPALSPAAAGGAVNFGSLVTPGTYTVQAVHKTTGCTTVFPEQIVIQKQPAKPVLVANALTYCGLPSGVHLSVTPESTEVRYQLYKDNVALGGFIYGQAGLAPIVWQNVTTGSYRVVASNDGGCAVTSDPIVVTTGGLSAYMELLPPAAGCVGTEFTLRVSLSGTPPFNFQIFDDKNNLVQTVAGYNPVPATNPITYTMKVTPSSSTSYYVKNILDAKGTCNLADGTGAAVVTVHPTPFVTVNPTNPQICVGQQTVTLNALSSVPGSTFVWSATSGGAPLTGASVTVSPSVTTTYTVTATSPAGCTGTGQVTVTVNPLPTADFLIPTSVCANGSPVPLIGTPAGGSFTVNGVPISQFDPALYAPNLYYTIRYEVTSGGCSVWAERVIFVNPLPVVQILNLQPVYCADAGTFTITGRPDRIDAVPGRLDGYFTVNGDRFDPTDPDRFWSENIVNANVTATFDIAQILGIFEAPKDLTIRYYYTDINGCETFAQAQTQIRPDYNAQLAFSGLPINPCQDDLTEYPLIPSLNGNPLNPATETWTFTGPGVVDKGAGNFVFVPNLAGNGTHTINLNVRDIYGCSGGTSQSVTIGVVLDLGLGAVYCKTDAGVPIVPTPWGGMLTVKDPDGLSVGYPPIGVAPDLYLTWDPTNAKVGNWEFTYVYNDNGCVNSRTWTVNVVNTPNPAFVVKRNNGTVVPDNALTFCKEEGTVLLEPVQTGGNFVLIDSFGAVTNLGLSFDTRNLAYGLYSVRYRIGSATCFDVSEKIVRIQPPSAVDFNLELQYCSKVLDTDGKLVNNSVIIKAINPSNLGLPPDVVGKFYSEDLPIATDPAFLDDLGNNTAVIHPYKVDGPFVANIRVWFTYVDKNGCENTIVKTTTVYNVVNVSYATENGLYAFCRNSSAVRLIGSFASPDAGKLSGEFTSPLLPAGALVNNTKIDLNGLTVPDGTAVLNPALIPAGKYPIRYTYNSPEGCMAFYVKEIEIYDIPTKAKVIGEPYYCVDVERIPGDATSVGARLGIDYAQKNVEYQLLYENNLPPVMVFTPLVDGEFYFPGYFPKGTYTVRAKTANSCYEYMNNSFLVIENNVDITYIQKNIVCKGANNGEIEILATGGLAPYGFTYSTDNGITWTAPVSSNTFINLIPNKYLIKVIDQIGCESQPLVVNLIEPGNAVAVQTIPGSLRTVGCVPCTLGVDCEGSVEITIQGGTPMANNVLYPNGYEIRWYAPIPMGGYDLLAGFNNEVSAVKLAPGDYYVQVKDQNGCVVNHLFTIGLENQLKIEKNPDPAKHINNVCFGDLKGSFEFFVSGGSVTGSYGFQLNGQFVNPKTVAGPDALGVMTYRYENLRAGSYEVTATDQNYGRCAVILSPKVTILEPAQISAGISNLKNQSCQGIHDGQFEVLATGGTAPYQYSLDGTTYVATQLFVGLAPATYQVYVRDAAGCVQYIQPVVVLSANSLTALTTLVKPVVCRGDASGEVKVEARGGMLPYSYQWYSESGGVNTLIPGQISASASGLVSGNYLVVVSDASGCSATSLPVFVPQPATTLDFNLVVVADKVGCDCDPVTLKNCEGSARIEVNQTGGTAGYSVVWSNGVAANQVVNLAPGDYSVTVTNDNGCTQTKLFSIGQKDDLKIHELSRSATSCSNRQDGKVEVMAEGGSGTYEFRINSGNWQSNGTPVFQFTALPSGTYTVEVRDAKFIRCMTQLPGISITTPASIAGTATVTDASCSAVADGRIAIAATGGTGVFLYSIDNGATFSPSPVFSGLQGSLVGRPYYVVVANATDLTCTYIVGPTYVFEPYELAIADVHITPETCYQQGDARVTVTAAGGWSVTNNPNMNVTAYNYSIDGGNNWQSSLVFNGLAAGTYTVLLRDGNARTTCEKSRVVVIDPLGDIGSALDQKADVKCFGEATGSFRIKPVPAGALLEYRVTRGGLVISAWSTQQNYSGLLAGTYTVEVRRGTCIGNTVLNVVVAEPLAPLVLTGSSATGVTCPGGNDGRASVSVSGGVSPYQYVWTKLPTNNNVPKSGADADFERSGLNAGTYRVVVVDAQGCQVTADMVVTVPGDWNVQYTVTPVSILGVANGRIDIDQVTGATPAYQISWADGAAYDGKYARTDLAVGSYTYTITDSKGCTTTGTIPVPDNGALDVTVDWKNILCYGDLKGEFSVLILNGKPNFQISYTGPVSGVQNNYDGTKLFRVSNLPAGTYTVKVTDVSGAEVIRIFTITQPLQPLVLNAGALDTQCFGTNQGTITAQASGGTPFAGGYAIDVLPGHGGFTGTTRTVTNLAPGIYAVRVTDSNACVVSQSVRVDEFPEVTIVKITTIPVKCRGGNDGSIEVDQVNGALNPDYIWEYLDASNNWAVVPSVNGSKLGQLPAGTYRVTVNQNHNGVICSVTSANLVVTQPLPIGVNVSKEEITTCPGDATGKITVKATGGTAPYFISLNGAAPVPSASGNQIFPNLTGGSYLVVVTDANGCSYASNPVALTISEPQPLQVDLWNARMECDLNMSGEVSFKVTGGSVQGGVSRYRVTLTGTANRNLIVDNDYTTADRFVQVSLTGLPEGNYQIRVEDIFSTSPLSCAFTQNFELKLIHVQATVVQPVCETNPNGSISLVATGNAGTLSYLWKKKDAGGNYVNFATTQNIINLEAGSYQVTVSDPVRGCSVVKTIELTYQNFLSINGAIRDERCAGARDGAITNLVIAGVANPAYAWSGPNGFASTQREISNLEPGTYVITVTDLSTGCHLAASFEVKPATAIVYSLEKVVVNCDPYVRAIRVNGLSGGVPPYRFSWSGPSAISFDAATLTANGLVRGGVYTLTIADQNNCQVTQTINLPLEMNLSGAVDQLNCTGALDGVIDLTVSGGTGVFTYQWTKLMDATFSATTQDISGLSAGTYRVEVTDAVENCTRVALYEVRSPAVIQITGAITHVTCYGSANGKVVTTVSGGVAPYSFNWSNGGTTKDLGALSRGNYTLVVTDANGCTANATFKVNEPDAIAFDLAVTKAVECDGTGASLEIQNLVGGWLVEGGVAIIQPQYDIVWAGPGVVNGNRGAMQLFNLMSGTYVVTITDASAGRNSCKVTRSVTLPAALRLTHQVVPETCAGQTDGEIRLTATGGVEPYQYAWSTADGIGLDVNAKDQIGLSAGTYRVEVTDARNCKVVHQILVSRDYQLDVRGSATDIACFGQNTGSILINVSGGSGNYSYLWTGTGSGIAPAAKDQNSLSAGSYSVTVTDQVLGCQRTENFFIQAPASALLISNVSVTDVLCKGNATGEITVGVQGGTPFVDGTGTAYYQYNWSGPGVFTNGATQSNLIAGDYKVVVTDRKGCVVNSATITLKEPALALDAQVLSITDVTAFGGNNGEIEIVVAGGTGAYSIVWSGVQEGTGAAVGGLTLHATRQTGLVAGTYQVTITDLNGCSVTLQNMVVRQPGSALDLVVTSKNIRPCSGDASGQIDLSAVGGKLPYTLSWYNSSGTLLGSVAGNATSIQNLQPGVYIVAVVDANHEYVSKQVTLTQPSALALNAQVVQHPVCYAEPGGALGIVVGGGLPNATGHYRVLVSGPSGYTYSNNTVPAGTALNLTGLYAGTYQITLIDDSNGDNQFNVNQDCSMVAAVTLIQPEAKVTLSGDADFCIGSTTQLKLVVSNWNPVAQPLQVLLSDGTTVTVNDSPYLFNVNPVVTTRYTLVSATDGAGCAKGTVEGQADVVVRPLPTARMYGDRTICRGESTSVFVDLTGSGPWNIVLFDGIQNYPVNGIGTTPFQFNITPLTNQNLTVLSVRDQHCTNVGEGSAVIRVNELPQVTLSGNQTICTGEVTNLKFNFTQGVAPFTVSYTENGFVRYLPNLLPDASGLYELPVQPFATTLYELLQVTDVNGCVQTLSGQVAEVAVRPLPTPPGAISGPALVCQGAKGVAYAVAPVANTTGYRWELPAGMILVSGLGSPSITVEFAPNFAGGVVTVYALNSCGEAQSAEKLIGVNELPGAAGAIDGPVELCQGTKGITYSIAAVANASEYEWTLPVGFQIVAGAGTAQIIVDLDEAVNLLTGVIRVLPKNSCGNGVVSPDFAVRVTPLPVANAGNDMQLCASSYVLQANAPGTGQAGEWTILSGSGVIAPGQFTNPNAVVDNLSQGENRLLWKVHNTTTGCFVTDEVRIYNNLLNVSAIAEERVVCDGMAIVHGSVLPMGTTGLWSFEEGSGLIVNATQSTTQITQLAPGRNLLRWTIDKYGCKSYAEVELINNQPDQAVIAGELLQLCTDQVTLSANVPAVGTGLWTRVAGAGLIDDPTQATIQVTALGIGSNVFRYTITRGGCATWDEIVVRNNMLNVDAGKDVTTCADVVKLAAKAAPSGASAYWQIVSGSGVFSQGDSPVSTISGLAPGDNILEWVVNQNGCISTDRVVIASNKPTDALTGSTRVVCDDEAVLSGNKPVSGDGFWTVVSGSGVFVDQRDPQTRVTGLQQGINVFRWNIVNNGCVSQSDQIVENLRLYTNAGKDTSICSNSTSLRGNVPTLGRGEWTLVAGMGGATIADKEDPFTRVGGLDTGVNGFVWTITYRGCTSRDTVKVINNRPYEVNAGPDQILSGAGTRLNASLPTVGKGYWTLVAGGGTIDDPLNPFSEFTGIRRGDNILRWTVQNNGCEAYDDVTITNGQTIDANAGLDRTLCVDYVTLEGNDPDVGIGEWSVVSGSGKIEQPYNPKTRVYELGSGMNVFRWSIHYTNSVSRDEVIVINNKPSKANAGPDRAICRDEHVLEGNIPIIGQPSWTMISGSGLFNDVALPNAHVTKLSKGLNVLKYEITNNGCVSVDTVKILNDLADQALAGRDEVVCTDVYELRPNNPTYGKGEWQVVEGSAKFDGNFARDLAQGRNVFAWVIKTTTPGCESRDELEVINNKPSTAFAGNDRDLCVDNVRLSAEIPRYGVGRWTLLSGSGTIANEFDAYTTVTGLALGSNRFRWTVDNHGCVSTDEVEIRNNFIQSRAGVDLILCTDETTLDANNPSPGSGTWGVKGGSGKAIFDDPSNPLTVVRGLDKGDNILTWTITHKNCPSVSEITITNNAPSTANAGVNQNLCTTNRTVLNASIPVVGTGRWTIRNGGGNVVNAAQPSTAVDNLAFGDNIFRWTIDHKGCLSEDDVQISYNRIQAIAGPEQTICSESTQMEANNANPGQGTWSIVGGTSQAFFADQHNPASLVTGLAKGVNVLRWTIHYRGCETFEEVAVRNDLPSLAYAGNSIEICDNLITLDASPVDVGVGRWSVLTGSGTIADVLNPKTEVTQLSKGDNVFRWTVLNNSCTLTDEVRITNNRPSEPYAGRDEEICASTFQLKANTVEFGKGLWSIVKGSGNFSNPTSPVSSISNLSEGENILRWTLTQGQCSLFDEVILVNNSAQRANAGPDIDDCKDWATLDANVATRGAGQWSLVSGKGVFDDALNPKTTIRGLGFGENILQWTISNGNCFTTDQVTIINRIPDQAKAGTDRTICEDYLVLNANDPTTGIGSWSVVSGKGVFDNVRQHNTTVRQVGYGTNVYRWTIAYGNCTTIDEVTVISQKADPYAGEDDVTYVNRYELKAANPGTIPGRWTILAGGGVFDDPTYYNTMVTGLHPGVNTFRWTINTEGCVAFDDVLIDYREVPEAGFKVDVSEGCYPLTVRFTDQSIGASSYHWDFADGSQTAIRNPIHTFTQPGNYNVVLTTPGPDGKDTQFSLLIKVFDHPRADFDAAPTLVFLPDDVVRFRNFSVDGVRFSWNFGDGKTSEEKNPAHKYTDEGKYTITLNVWNQYGCEDKLTKFDFVEARRGGYINFPNAFRPRPDAGSGSSQYDLNAIFKPSHQDVDQYHLMVFNRWGQLIFESKNIDEGWNGFFGGQMAQQEVYVWVAKGRFISGKEFNKTGHVLLVR